MLYTPLLHGALGILDELLLFGAPLIVVLIILIINSRRARAKNPPRERERVRTEKTNHGDIETRS